MLSKAKLKSAIKNQDVEEAKQLIPTIKQFKIMARNKMFHRLIAPAIKLLFSDKDYYKKVFSVNVMTTMFFFTHHAMKDFSYLKEREYEDIHESLIRPLLNDHAMFFEAINTIFELKYFEDNFFNHKNELAKMVITSPKLFWRVIQSFSNLQLFCEEHPSYAREAIFFVLCDPEKMKNLLYTAISETIFAGYCLAYSLIDKDTQAKTVPLIVGNAKESIKDILPANRYAFFNTNKSNESCGYDDMLPTYKKKGA